MKETYYSHNKVNFFKYNANYRQKFDEVIIRKYTFDTTQIVDEHVLKTSFDIQESTNLIIFNNLTVPMVTRIFKEEAIYHDINDILPYIVVAVKEERLNPRFEAVQDIIDSYPELFI